MPDHATYPSTFFDIICMVKSVKRHKAVSYETVLDMWPILLLLSRTLMHTQNKLSACISKLRKGPASLINLSVTQQSISYALQ